MKTIIKTGFAAILFLTFSCKKESSTVQLSTITDVSNMVAGKYPSVLIGTQRWMIRNLDVTRYRNGDKIPQVKDPVKWGALTTGAWCWYNNDSATGAVYGKLYNWYAVTDPRGLAPTGWHIPSDSEWAALPTFLGKNAGGKLKDTGTIEAGTGLWYAPNTGATNKTGFTGLPGGYCYGFVATFDSKGSNGLWWSSTERNDGYILIWSLAFYDGSFNQGSTNGKQSGFSVRCIKN